MKNKIKSFLYGFLLLHGLWFAGHFLINTRLIPLPQTVYAYMDGQFWLHMIRPVVHSLWRIFFSMGIAILIGLVFGVLMAQSKLMGKILNPLIYFTFPIPKMAFLPIVMINFGLGNPTIITMIVLIIVFQIIINVRDSILAIPQENYQTLLVLGANKWRILKDVTLPAALSQILSSSRVALGTATAILFITENNGRIYGVGRFIMDAQTRIDYVSMFAGIFVLSMMSFLLFLLIDVLEKTFMKWR